MVKGLDIEKYKQLLDKYGLPKNTPKNLVIDLLEQLEDKNIDRKNGGEIEAVLLASALWAWVQGEQINLNEELPFESFAQRIASLFGV